MKLEFYKIPFKYGGLFFVLKSQDICRSKERKIYAMGVCGLCVRLCI